jgi:hypothetical protein
LRSRPTPPAALQRPRNARETPLVLPSLPTGDRSG